jgi:peptidyl-prolyl cis-trans isomerase SDCCAG10
MNGQCTLFGRLEGDSIFNVLKIADAERVDDTERPVYPVKVTSCEVGELGPLAGKLKDRQIVSSTSADKVDEKHAGKKKKKAAKGGKALLSFGADEGDEEIPMRRAKPKFNPKLVADMPETAAPEPRKTANPPQTRKRPRSPSPKRSPSTERRQRPRTPDPLAQLPLPDPESPVRSPSPVSPPAKESKLSRTNAQIDSIKASMRRNIDTGPADTGRKKSALEAMIPDTAIRGRKRPPPAGSVNGAGRGSSANGVTGFSSAAENDALRLFNAFKARLEGAESQPASTTTRGESRARKLDDDEDADDEEAQLCDLHFIANCQSCQSWDKSDHPNASADTREDEGWLTHELRFGKDTLGKDLSWKREHPGDADSFAAGTRRRGLQRDRERERKRERAGDLEWDRERRR